MFRLSRRALLGMLGALPATKALAAMPAAAAGQVPLGLVRDIHLDAADPAGIWAEIAQPYDTEAMRGLVAAIMADVRRKPSWSLGWSLATKVAYHAIYRPFGLYMDESDYFAGLLGPELVAKSDMAGLQRLYTLAHAGCSSVMAWDESLGRMVHFRSLDWPSAAAIAKATRIYQGTRADGTRAFSAAGILGMSGLLTAVKPGFSLAINFAPWSGTSFSLNADPTFLVRQLMASPTASYHDAFRLIEAWRPGAPVFISLCGVAKGEACVFELGSARDQQTACNLRPMGDRPYLIQTNHFDGAGPFARHNKPQVLSAPDAAAWDGLTILETSVARQAVLEQALNEAFAGSAAPDLAAALRRAFARPPVWNHETAQWVMMVPQSGQLQAWVREA